MAITISLPTTLTRSLKPTPPLALLLQRDSNSKQTRPVIAQLKEQTAISKQGALVSLLRNSARSALAEFCD